MNPDFRDMLSAFLDAGVEFLLVDAYALAVHGLPRATGDIDLWVGTSGDDPRRVWHALEQFGAPLDRITPDDLAQPDLIFQIGVAPSRIDVLTAIDGVDFATAWTHRTVVDVDGLRVPIISREHLMQNKRASGRPQDLADVARLEHHG